MNLALLLLAAEPAHATELVWEGYYRARGLYYNSLSLANPDTNENAEGASFAFDNRLSLRPAWLLSEHASIHAQLDVLAFSAWGDMTDVGADPVTGEDEARATADGVTTDGPGITAARAWGEVSTKAGTFRAGRMPMEWGAGILWNPGNEATNEYGDTADRLSYSNRFGPVWLMGSYDVQYEGYENDQDDMQSLSLAVGYLGETSGVGLLNSYRYQPAYDWQEYTGDLWGRTALGPLTAELELVAKLGGGSTETGINDVSETAFGGMLDVGVQREKIGFGVEAGFATGDADPNDDKLHTFSFDPDHDVALMLFEESLPTLAASVATDTNEGRETGAVLTGDGVSNAIYARPRISYQLRPDLRGELAWVTATLAKGPADTDKRHGFGNEFDLSLRYDPVPHVWAQATGGVLLPGKYYTQYEDTKLGGGFEKPAFGFRLLGTVEF